MSSNSDPILFSVIVAGSGLGLILTTLYKFKTARKIQDTARIDISSAPQGLVEIQGYAWPLEQTIQDSSNNSCILLEYKVQRLVKSGKSSSWKTYRTFSHLNQFLVFDNSGECIVDPGVDSKSKINLEAPENIVYLSSFPNDHQEVLTYAIKRSKGFLGFVTSTSNRIVEKKVLVGSPIFVQGSMTSSAINQISVPGDFKKYSLLIKTLRTNLIHRIKTLDLDGSGTVTTDEEYLGLNGAAVALLNQNKTESKISGVISESSEHALIVADCHEHILLNRLTSFMWTKLLIGVGLCTFGIYLLISRLK